MPLLLQPRWQKVRCRQRLQCKSGVGFLYLWGFFFFPISFSFPEPAVPREDLYHASALHLLNSPVPTADGPYDAWLQLPQCLLEPHASGPAAGTGFLFLENPLTNRRRSNCKN